MGEVTVHQTQPEGTSVETPVGTAPLPEDATPVVADGTPTPESTTPDDGTTPAPTPEVTEPVPGEFDYRTSRQEWIDEFVDTGTLTEATEKSIFENIFREGIDPAVAKEFLDVFKDGVTSNTQMANLRAWDSVGGEENYKAMIDWAGKNFSEAESKAFDDALGRSPADASVATKGLWAQYQQAGGVAPAVPASTEPDLAHSATPSVGEGQGLYKSDREASMAQRSEKYKKDPAERRRVDSIIKKSMEAKLI